MHWLNSKVCDLLFQSLDLFVEFENNVLHFKLKFIQSFNMSFIDKLLVRWNNSLYVKILLFQNFYFC